MKSARCIVVGAGPAGCSAAAHLAMAGVDVLLLERSTTPRDKICGDGLSPASLRELRALGLGEAVAREAQVADGAVVCAPNGATVEVEHPSLTVHVCRRLKLDDLLQERARRLGARLRSGVGVRDIRVEADRVRVECAAGESFVAPLVVVASGAHSPLPLRQGLQRQPSADAVARRAYYEGVDHSPRRLLFCYARELLPGYGWVFPLGDGAANVGVGYFLSEGRPDLAALFARFEQWLRRARILHQGSRRASPLGTALLRAGLRRNRIAGERVLLAGDAAAAINPLTGEGISQALITGRLAAQTACEALASGELSAGSLAVHRRRVRAALPTTRAYAFTRMLFRSPHVVDMVVASARCRATVGHSVFATIVGELDPRVTLLHVASGLPAAAWAGLRREGRTPAC